MFFGNQVLSIYGNTYNKMSIYWRASDHNSLNKMFHDRLKSPMSPTNWNSSCAMLISCWSQCWTPCANWPLISPRERTHRPIQTSGMMSSNRKNMLKLAPVTCEYSIIPEILRTQRQRWRPRRAHTHTHGALVSWLEIWTKKNAKRRWMMNPEPWTMILRIQNPKENIEKPCLRLSQMLDPTRKLRMSQLV